MAIPNTDSIPRHDEARIAYEQDQDYVYVRNSLKVGGRSLDSRITKWCPKNQPIQLSSDVIRRIQQTHTTILDTLIPEKGEPIDPTRISIRLFKAETTKVFLDDQEYVLGETSIKTIHTAMQSLYTLLMSEQAPRPLPFPPAVDAIDLPQSARSGAIAEEREQPVPPMNTSVPSASLEGGHPRRRPKPQMPAMVASVVAAMDKVVLKDLPVHWPKTISVEEFSVNAYPSVRAGFRTLLQNPESEDPDAIAARQLFYAWFEAGYTVYKADKMEQTRKGVANYSGYFRYIKDEQLADNNRSREIYMKYIALWLCFFLLGYPSCDKTPLFRYIINNLGNN